MSKDIYIAAARVYADKDRDHLREEEWAVVSLLEKEGFLIPDEPVKGDICSIVTRIYAGKDWHKLREEERALVSLLEKEGYLIPNKPANGFVGKVAQ